MNTLAKFKHKPSSHGAPVLSFRFNPGEDDLEVCKSETVVSDDSCCPPTGNQELANQEANRRDSSGSEGNKSRKNSEDTSTKVDPNGNEAKTTKESSSQQPEVNLLKDSRDSSPLKESVREYLAKVGKRSSSLDYTPVGSDSEGWSILSGIRGKIVKKIEEVHRAERLKKEATLDMVQEKNNAAEVTKPFISSRSRSSCDVRSRLEDDSGISVEQGLDCAATDDSGIPYTYHLEEKDALSNTNSSQSSTTTARKSVVSAAAVPSGTGLLSRKRSKNFSKSITLSSLKATHSLESEILMEDNDFDDDTWEHVEVSRRLEEKPEEPMLFQDTTSHNEVSDNVTEDYGSGEEGDYGQKQLWTLLLQPTMRKKLIGLLVTFLAIYFAPISNFLSGFLMGAFVSLICGVFLVWFLREPKPKEQIRFPNYSTLPPLRIPSPDIRREETKIFKGWMNELDSEYNADTYQVNSTHSIFVRLDGTSLRLSKPKINVPKRAMWNEPKYTPVFVGQRHFQILHAQVSLPPEGLAKKRLWSKKYPICLVIKSAQATLPAQQWVAQGGCSEDESCSDEKSVMVHLFARTSREKEEWFQRFQSAASQSALEQGDDNEEPRMLPSIDFHSYGKWIVSEEDILTYVKSACPTNDPQYGDTTPEHVWLNALIGRVFYDFLTKKFWSQAVGERIQKKLSVIKVPYFMEELKLKDINLGSNLPIFHRMSQPVMDTRGLWVDFDVTYKGTFQMTLETKLNLLRLKKEQAEAAMSSPVDEKVNKSYLYNSDEESSAESSSEDEISPTDTLDAPVEDGLHMSARVASTSKTLLKWVDKITQSRYFQQATENRYIKKAMTEVSNTALVLTVQVHALVGTLAINIPPPPSDRLWYGFRGNPQLSITARPKLGEHEVTLSHVTEWIEKKLTLEFQKLLVMPNMDDLVIPIMESGLKREEKAPSTTP